jgi:hypothetical protein
MPNGGKGIENLPMNMVLEKKLKKTHLSMLLRNGLNKFKFGIV